MRTTTRTQYLATLVNTDDGGDAIQLTARTVHRVTSTDGRRQWTKEARLDAQAPDVVLATLTMGEAAGLLASLAGSVGFVAAGGEDY